MIRQSKLRSWLFTPANHQRRVAKALSSDAHAIIIDLEDAVSASEKLSARASLETMLVTSARANLFVRINALSTEFALDDIAAVVGPHVRGIMLPKAESSRDIETLDWLIGQMERRASLEIGSVEIIPLVETAEGLQNISSICRSSQRLKRLAFGAADFTLDMGISWSAEEEELSSYRSTIVLASRSAGLEAPIDTPWTQIDNQEAMVASAKRAHAHGFMGKMCIHPDQIKLVNEVYAPSQTEVENARRIVSEFESAGSAAIKVNGQMIDYPLVDAARRLLQEAAQCQQSSNFANQTTERQLHG